MARQIAKLNVAIAGSAEELNKTLDAAERRISGFNPKGATLDGLTKSAKAGFSAIDQQIKTAISQLYKFKAELRKAENVGDVASLKALENAAARASAEIAKIRAVGGAAVPVAGDGIAETGGGFDATVKGFTKELGSSRGLKKLLKGGLVGYAGSELAMMTAEMVKLNDEFSKGELDAGEFFSKILQGLPIIGGFAKAGENINEFFTHAKRDSDALASSIGLVDSALSRQRKGLEASAKAIRDLDDVISELSSKNRLIGTSGFERQLLMTYDSLQAELSQIQKIASDGIKETKAQFQMSPEDQKKQQELRGQVKHLTIRWKGQDTGVTINSADLEKARIALSQLDRIDLDNAQLAANAQKEIEVKKLRAIQDAKNNFTKEGALIAQSAIEEQLSGWASSLETGIKRLQTYFKTNEAAAAAAEEDRIRRYNDWYDEAQKRHEERNRFYDDLTRQAESIRMKDPAYRSRSEIDKIQTLYDNGMISTKEFNGEQSRIANEYARSLIPTARPGAIEKGSADATRLAFVAAGRAFDAENPMVYQQKMANKILEDIRSNTEPPTPMDI